MGDNLLFWTMIGGAGTVIAALAAILTYASSFGRRADARARQAVTATVIGAIGEFGQERARQIRAGVRHPPDIHRKQLIEACGATVRANTSLSQVGVRAQESAGLCERHLEKILPHFAFDRPYPELEFQAQTGAGALTGAGIGTIVPGLGHVVGGLIGTILGGVAGHRTVVRWRRLYAQHLEAYCSTCRDAVERNLPRML